MSIEAYYPELLSLENIKEEEYNKFIMEVNLEVGRFDGMLRHNPRKETVKAFLRAEEVLSAASLEISELSFDEYLDKLLDRGYEADNLVEIKFMIDYYIEQNSIVKEKGFSFDTLNNFQKKILENCEKRSLGQSKFYRTRQVWLVEAAEELDVRLYVHTNDDIIKELTDNLENYIRNSRQNSLIIAAIAYGQLAMIHPWRYANGRITGALIPYMFNFLGITRERSFYLSGAFRKNKEEYYHQLLKLFKENNWQEWINYFLRQVKKQAVSGQKKVEHIVGFCSKMEKDVLKQISTKDIKIYSEVMLSHPIFTPKDLERKNGFPKNALDRYIYRFFRLTFKNQKQLIINILDSSKTTKLKICRKSYYFK